MNNRNVVIVKLQNDLATITAEWEDKSEQDIHNLGTAFLQTAQMERTRIARMEIVPQVAANDELKSSQIQIASNVKFKKQSKF